MFVYQLLIALTMVGTPTLALAGQSGVPYSRPNVPQGDETAPKPTVAIPNVSTRTGKQVNISEVDIPIGQGFNTLTGEIRGNCLGGKALVSDSARFRVSYDLTLISSSSELRKQMGLTAAASFGYGIWGADATSSYYRSSQRTQNADYLLVTVNVEGPTYRIQSAKLNNDALKWKVKSQDFLRACGNSFLSQAVLGGQFAAVVQIESETEKDRSETRAALKVVARGYGTGAVEFAQAMESVKKYSKTQVKILRSGTSEELPEPSIESILKYSLSFSTKITPSTAYPVRLVYTDYQTIDPALERYVTQEVLLNKWADYLGELSRLSGDLEYVDRFKAQMFPVPNSSQIERWKSEIDTAKDALARVAFACANDPKNKCKEENFTPLMPTLPKRAVRTVLNSRSSSSQLIGGVGPDEVRNLVILGKWSPWDNGNGWLNPEHCCFTVETLFSDGRRDTRNYAPPMTVKGPGQISVKLHDDPYNDNRHDGLEAVLY